MTSKSAFEISSDQKVHLVSAANKIGKFSWPVLEYREDIECRWANPSARNHRKAISSVPCARCELVVEKQSSPQKHIKETTLVIIFHLR